MFARGANTHRSQTEARRAQLGGYDREGFLFWSRYRERPGMQQWLREQTSWWAADVGKYFRATCSLRLRWYSTKHMRHLQVWARCHKRDLVSFRHRKSCSTWDYTTPAALPAWLLPTSLNRLRFNKRLNGTRSLWLSWVLHRMCLLGFYRLLTWKACEVYLIIKVCGSLLAGRVYSQNTFRGLRFFPCAATYRSRFLFHPSLFSYCSITVICLDNRRQPMRLCKGIYMLCETLLSIICSIPSWCTVRGAPTPP